MRKSLKKLTLREVEYIAYSLAKQLMDYDEPMPEFSTRFPGKLESCLAQPFQMFDGKDLYPGIADKAAILFYLITKNHPFENGNKRMAVTVTLVFLYENGLWINATPDQLYRLALHVAESEPKDKEPIVRALTDTIDKFKIKAGK